jgi:hypothetical protein
MIRLGIAGTHDSLYELIPALQEGSDFQVTGMHSLHERELFSFTDKLMLQPVIISETLLMRADAILVVSDPSDYFDLLIKSLQLSKHLFLSSLGSLSLKQIESLIKLAGEAQVIVHHPGMLGQNHVGLLKQFIHHPFYIEISCLNSFSVEKRHSSEELSFLTLKATEALLSINSGSILKVQPHTSAIFADQIDFMNTRIDFANGCAGILTTGLFSEKNEFKVKAYQRNEIIEMDFIQKKITSISLGTEHNISARSFPKGKYQDFSLEYDLVHFRDMIQLGESSINSLEKSYHILLLKTRILEKVQIPVFQEK